MLNYQIRKLASHDLNELFSLRLEALQNSPTSFLFTYEEESSFGPSLFESLLNPENLNSAIFGSYINNELVGMVAVHKKNLSRIIHKSHIWGTYVKPAYRNRSIGKSLMQAAIAYAKNEMKCSMVCLSVITTNQSALKLYQSLGFKVWGKEESALIINGQPYDEYYAALQI